MWKGWRNENPYTRPMASATGGETSPLEVRINPMKNTFLDTHQVLLKRTPMSKQK
jgi:hypothetical protein